MQSVIFYMKNLTFAIPYIIHSCMEEVYAGVMTKTTRLKWGRSQFTYIADNIIFYH